MSLSDASPSSSPSLSPTRSRRLSARRGSVSASDPWGTYSKINNDPLRATSSRLTIVRVPKEDEDASQRRHRRHGSNASLNSNASSGKGETSRMSFAFSSFTPANKDGQHRGGSDGSPTSSPRMRPHSPSSLSRRYSGSLVHSSKLSPEQLLDVARSSCNPRLAVAAPGTSPVTPAAPSPISFTPLPDSIYLPFVDRPGEVAQLMTTPPSAKLFALLAQVYSADARKLTGTESAETLLAKDPRQWAYSELAFWLKDVDRDDASDVQWVMKARACIIAKSEPLWERVKGALGVPHELDIDEEELPSIVEPADDDAAAAMENEAERYPPVFETPSPASAVNSASPNTEGDESVLIEPVVAQGEHPPTSSALDPLATHELTEVREEDEDAEDKSDTYSVSDSLDPEVHGLRIMTAPASQGSAFYATSPMPLESPAINPMAIPRSHSFHDKDAPYDALAERGPGHPLFPSSFAHLSMRPTLGGKYVFVLLP